MQALFSQVLCSISTILFCKIIFSPGGLSCLQTCTKNHTTARLSTLDCEGEHLRAKMTFVGVLGRRDPPPAPFSSSSPLQCPGLFLQRCHQPEDQDLSDKAPGWLLSRTLSLRPPVAADGGLRPARPAPSIVWDVQPNTVDPFWGYMWTKRANILHILSNSIKAVS